MDKAELRERLKNWHDEILSGYLSIFSGEKDAMFRMKEIWAYMHGLFSDSEKLWKKIKNARRLMTISQSFEWHLMLFKI